MLSPGSLSPDFEWGFATAAYQVEGGADSGGRGKSIWDTFCHLEPSRTKGANGDVACDHYNRYEADFDLLSAYGAKAYRFSISWSRIIPLGGRHDCINEEGVAFYDQLIDSLLQRGMTPWVTLHHWDLPQALHDRYGGWLNLEQIQQDFERFARLCFARFGDRVRNWITFNEPWIIAIYGYGTGINAPGRSCTNTLASEGNSSTEPWIVGKSLIMSHARAVNVYNKEFRALQGGQIGISLNGDYYEPWDTRDSRDQAAAQRRMEFHIAWFADPIYLGRDYPECMRRQLGDRLPQFSEEEFSLLRETVVDFYGMNYYTAQFARHQQEAASSFNFNGNVIESQEGSSGVSIGDESGVCWLRVCPAQFRKLLGWIYTRYQKPIYVTENGCPCPGEEKMTREESLEDAFRINYFETHVDAIVRASSNDSVDVRGYFAWSLLDNLEWSDGYGVRFGVTYTDYETLERTPKNSAMFLKKLFKERLTPVRQNLDDQAQKGASSVGQIEKVAESKSHL